MENVDSILFLFSHYKFVSSHFLDFCVLKFQGATISNNYFNRKIQMHVFVCSIITLLLSF